ncbi:hypothetical protein ZWY2020_016199 [Hordeum vulgare]|nr:hypothetical protein ZWY2020_016199 [Hordeum vulgare]
MDPAGMRRRREVARAEMLATGAPCFPIVSACHRPPLCAPTTEFLKVASGERERWEEVASAQSSTAMAIDLSVRTGLAAHKLVDTMLHRIRDRIKMTCSQ